MDNSSGNENRQFPDWLSPSAAEDQSTCREGVEEIDGSWAYAMNKNSELNIVGEVFPLPDILNLNSIEMSSLQDSQMRSMADSLAQGRT